MEAKELAAILREKSKQEMDACMGEVVKVFFGYCCSTKNPDQEQAIQRLRNGIAASSRAHEALLELAQRIEDNNKCN